MRKGFIIILLSCVLAVMLAGCASGAESPGEAGRTTFTDYLGREVTIEGVPQRIVSISPACTEVLFALGLGDKVVGVTEYCDYPEEATQKPEIGTFSTPNIEAIVAVEPDLVLATGGIQEEMTDRMEELELAVYVVNPKTLEETVESIRRMGEITGTGEKAEEIAGDMERKAAAIGREVEQRESEGAPRPKVFFEIYYENNVWTAGYGSVISDLIALAGGDNIGDVESSDYYEFSVESLISEDPDVYLVGSGSMSDPGDITARPGWDGIKAIRENRVHVIEEDLVYRTGPRLIQGLETIYEAINK